MQVGTSSTMRLAQALASVWSTNGYAGVVAAGAGSTRGVFVTYKLLSRGGHCPHLRSNRTMSFDIYADDFQSLQDALNEAATTGKTLHLTPRARYAVTAPIVLDNVSVRLDGHGASILADVPMLARWR